MEGMFAHCTGLTDIDVSLDTSSVTNMYFMFYNCNALTSLDVSSFDTSSVLSMHYMFFDCSGLTSLDVSSFNTSAVTDMNHMFFTRGVLTSIVGVEDFDITGLDSTGDLTDFLTGGRMTTAQYDNLLVKWEAQAVFSGLTPSFGASTYTGGSAAATARAALSSNDSWNITDGGIA
jgi:surface protein